MAIIIAFDGISGAGKTTTARVLRAYLLRRDYRALVINEKEYEPLRSWIMSWHRRSAREKAFSWKDIVEIAQARAVVHASIVLNLAQYDIVLFDRSLYTSAVYQSSAKIFPREIIEVNLSLGAIEPAVVFMFLGDVQVCHGRILERGRKRSLYNLPAMAETPDQLLENLGRYITLSSLLENVVQIDASLPTAIKVKEILSVLRDLEGHAP